MTNTMAESTGSQIFILCFNKHFNTNCSLIHVPSLKGNLKKLSLKYKLHENNLKTNNNLKYP